MKPRADAPYASGPREEIASDAREGERFARRFQLFTKSLENGNTSYFQEDHQHQRMRRIKHKKLMTGETFAVPASSIRVQPEVLRR
ncbi:MAG: hypothetical protein WB543_18545 [Candidatus Acidiferrum sp.]